jgi:multidrug efflux system membrane fusion protein
MRHRLVPSELRVAQEAPAATRQPLDFVPSRRAKPISTCRLCCLAGLAATVVGSLAGCGQKSSTEPDAGPPAVTVSQPIEREVTDYVEFVGRTEAPFSLDVRSRVTGYLTKTPFTEGTTVKAGDVLFEIDDRPYKDELDQAQATLEEAKAGLVKAQAFLDIGLDTQKLSAGAVSQQEIVQRQGARDQAAAAVKSAEATLEKCKLNYEWCKVTSAIDGRVSRYYVTLGNLVSQDTTLLTTVVSEDPLYAYFDIDERTVLRIVRHLMPQEVDLLKTKQVPVYLGLADEDGFPHTGYINFANNTVNAATGTVTVRGVFDNPVGPSGRRLLKPGMFVRIRLPIGKPHQALLVSEKALGTDQGQKFLYVVDAKNLVQYRPVKVGPLQSDGLRVILEGLEAGQWVLVDGLQLVRPQLEVKPEQMPMVAPDNGSAKKDSAGPKVENDQPAAPDASKQPAAPAPSDHS